MNEFKQEVQPVLAKQRDTKVFKEFVESLPEQKRTVYKERFNALDPQQKEVAIQKAIIVYGTREKSREQQSSMGQQAIDLARNSTGGVSNAIGSGVSTQDIPGVIGDVINGAGMGVPRAIDQQKAQFGIAGVPGVGMAQGANMGQSQGPVSGLVGQAVSLLQGIMRPQTQQVPFKPSKELIPIPETLAGKIGGQAAGLVAGYGVNKLLDIPGANQGQKVLSQLKGKTEPGANLADELSARMEEARKTVGANQGGYIEANANELVDTNKFNEIMSKAPKSLQEDVALIISDPQNVTLKEAEIARGIIKGRVPSSKWNIKTVDETTKNIATQAYDDIGKVMTNGRPELSEAMGNYADVKNAQKQIIGRLETKTGMTKSNPILDMFGKNVDNADVQAIEKLAESNPEILDTLNKIKKLSTKLERTEAMQSFIKKHIKGAATTATLAGGAYLLGKKR